MIGALKFYGGGSLENYLSIVLLLTLPVLSTLIWTNFTIQIATVAVVWISLGLFHQIAIGSIDYFDLDCADCSFLGPTRYLLLVGVAWLALAAVIYGATSYSRHVISSYDHFFFWILHCGVILMYFYFRIYLANFSSGTFFEIWYNKPTILEDFLKLSKVMSGAGLAGFLWLHVASIRNRAKGTT